MSVLVFILKAILSLLLIFLILIFASIIIQVILIAIAIIVIMFALFIRKVLKNVFPKFFKFTYSPSDKIRQETKPTSYKEVFIYCIKYFKNSFICFWSDKCRYCSHIYKQIYKKPHTRGNKNTFNNAPKVIIDKSHDTIEHSGKSIPPFTKGCNTKEGEPKPVIFQIWHPPNPPVNVL